MNGDLAPGTFDIDGYWLAESSEWRRVRAMLVQRLENRRQINDRMMTPEQTLMLRGRIAELKELLALGQPDPASVADPDEASASEQRTETRRA